MEIKILFLLLFFGSMVGIGLYSRKHATNVAGFVLGGRSVGPWLTAFAYGTSYFSAVVFVGYAGQFGWKYGLAGTWIGIGNAIIGSLLAWVVLGRRTRVMTKHLHNGLSRLFELAFDVPYAVCVVVMAALTGAYVILGGYMATAINDFIQGIIMLFGIAAVIGAVLSGQGGFTEAVRQLADIPSDVPVTAGQSGAFTSFFGPDPINLLGVVILTSLGTWGLPQMVQKFYAIKDEKAIQTGTVVSTVFAIVISGGCYFLGGFGRLFDNPSLYKADGTVIYDGIVPYMLSTLPDILIGVVIVLVLSASMSTLSSLVLTSSSTLTLDFLKGTVAKDMSEKNQLRVMRGLIVVFIAISVVLALDPPTFIAQLMGISWGALAGAFLAPFLFGLYWKRTTKLSVWVCFITGIGITVSNLFLHYIASPINAGAFAMVVGFVVVPVVSLVTPKMEKNKVEDIFCCYNQEVVSTPKKVLPQDKEDGNSLVVEA